MDASGLIIAPTSNSGISLTAFNVSIHQTRHVTEKDGLDYLALTDIMPLGSQLVLLWPL